MWHASFVCRWLTDCRVEIILAVGMRFSGRYRCEEVAVVKRVKIGVNVCMNCPYGQLVVDSWSFLEVPHYKKRYLPGTKHCIGFLNV